METAGETKKVGLYIGTGVGLVLFALVGLFPGSLIGGIAGLKAAGLLGIAQGTLFARAMAAGGMLTGVLLAAVVFILGMGAVGWAGGSVMESLTAKRQAAEELLKREEPV